MTTDTMTRKQKETLIRTSYHTAVARLVTTQLQKETFEALTRETTVAMQKNKIYINVNEEMHDVHRICQQALYMMLNLEMI